MSSSYTVSLYDSTVLILLLSLHNTTPHSLFDCLLTVTFMSTNSQKKTLVCALQSEGEVLWWSKRTWFYKHRSRTLIHSFPPLPSSFHMLMSRISHLPSMLLVPNQNGVDLLSVSVLLTSLAVSTSLNFWRHYLCILFVSSESAALQEEQCGAGLFLCPCLRM